MTEINTEATRLIAQDSGDIRVPRFGEDVSEPDAIELKNHLRQAPWSPDLEADDHQIDVGKAFIRQIPALFIAPAPDWAIPEHEEDYQWAKVRAFLGGWGHKANATLAASLRAIYPASPLDPEETRPEWEEKLRKAHALRGWAPTMACAPWRAWLRRDLVPRDYVPADWECAVACLHILKHLMWSRKYGLVIVYDGRATRLDADAATNLVVASSRVSGIVAKALRLPSAGERQVNPMGVAAKIVVGRLTTSDLVQRQRLCDLPQGVLHGPGAGYATNPMGLSGWAQTGLTLAGIRIARGGVVYHPRDVDFGPAEILRYDWPLDPPDQDDRPRATGWEEMIAPVTSYRAEFPSTLLDSAFPNLQWLCPAHRYIVDAAIIAQRLRQDVHGLAGEFPILGVLPAEATEIGATNTGKTRVSEAILQGLVPGLRMVTAQTDGTNMSGRSAMSLISADGTTGLDEWIPPKDPGDLLSFRNLQSMAVGQPAQIGQVYSNEGKSVTLKAPLVFNAKAAEFPPDMLSRLVFLWVRKFTAEERRMSENYERAQSGRLGVDIYLGTMALAADLQLAEKMAAAAIPSSSDGRFNRLRWLAAYLMVWAGAAADMETAYLKVDHGYSEIERRYQQHCREADDSGLLHSLAQGITIKAHLSAILPATADDAMKWRQFAKAKSANRAAGMTTSDLVQGAAELLGPGCSIREAARTWFGDRSPLAGASARTLYRAILAQLIGRMPVDGAKMALPGEAGYSGFGLVRKPSRDGSNMFDIYCENPAFKS
jgi:hypothetical protein